MINCPFHKVFPEEERCDKVLSGVGALTNHLKDSQAHVIRLNTVSVDDQAKTFVKLEIYGFLYSNDKLDLCE